MIVTDALKDIAQTLYAPHKSFKRILANPKYLGVIIIIVLFVALQTAYYFTYYSKVNFEQTSPTVDQLSAWTGSNATAWVTPATLTATDIGYINQTYYGNSSLQFNLANSNNVTASLNFNSSVNCAANGFHNLSMSIKLIEPTSAPQNATVYLYSSDSTSNYFQYDLKPKLSVSTVGEWNNLTLPVGTSDWRTTGDANWTDITSIKLTLTYTSNANITVLLQGLFFRGLYATVIDSSGGLAFAGSAVTSTVIQFLFQWIILTAVVWLILKGLKVATVVWRTLFIAVGFAFIVLAITSIISLLSTLALPVVYFPYDFPPYSSVVYPQSIVDSASLQSQAMYNSIQAVTSTFAAITTGVTILLYAWEVALLSLIVRFYAGLSWGKSVGVAIVSVVLTVLIFGLLAAFGLV